MEEQHEEPEMEMETLDEDGVLDTLTAYFRRTSRGRIVDLPRWAR